MTQADRIALAQWLVGKTAEDCLRLLTIGRLTAERIAAGEVEPEEDIAIRIRGQLAAPVPSSCRLHDSGSSLGGAGNGAAAFSFGGGR